MDNNMMMQFMQMMAQQNQMMQTMMMQLMTQPNPDPVQSAAPVLPSPEQIAAQSNAAVSASVQEIAELKAEIEKLKLELAAAQSELESTKKELETISVKERNATLDNINLKMSIKKAEADLGMSWADYMEQLNLTTGEDYYDKNRRMFEEMGLTNEERRELIEAYVDEQQTIGKPKLIDLATGKEQPSELTKVWDKINKRLEKENMGKLSSEDQQVAEQMAKKGNLSKSQVAGLLARDDVGF